MPQLAPNFWALNFIMIWTLLITITTLTISLPPSNLPSAESRRPLTPTHPNWPWHL
ncbi:ATP synthase F0 subunit 8 (mitochondrion) [Saccoglossus kowalevskii]|uniref:ATP synthase complex subunit 8 n=1 Tax=Saccoglossus kowalevskii TaxID=10224 RepID=Q3L8S5_SACKO|nr:ATP synthase F0 subunit 8 [Saccoglossus kowalevskii]AAQ92993.1 ATP synthase F0 subunit 8 [Saccoglossus kowalevskii]